MIMRDPQIQVRNEVELNQTHSSQTKRFTKDYPLLQDVIFVYGDNAADLDENGSAEHPFDVMQEGVDESAARDFPHVYVFGASRPYRENVRIMESLNLLGEGCPVGRGAPPSRGFGRPVVEGQAGPSLLTPAVLEIAGADRVRVRGFEFTAAPYAGGPWTSPFDGGSLAPLAGIYAQDVRDLTVDCNIFRNLVAGIVATYGPVADFDLTVTDNQFRNVGLGIGALTDVGGRAWIGGNDIQDALLGVGFLGLEMTGRAEVDVVGNTVTGSDALLDDGFTALSLVSAMSGNGFYGIPGEVLGHDELGNQPSDFLTVLPGLDDILPGGFNPADPPSLEEMVTAPQFGDLLGGQGFAGVMVHLDEADDDSAVYLTSNEIGNMENGIYIVVTDPDDAAVVDLVATDNLSADNVVIGEDTSRADYNLTASGAQQDPFDELPTP